VYERYKYIWARCHTLYDSDIDVVMTEPNYYYQLYHLRGATTGVKIKPVPLSAQKISHTKPKARSRAEVVGMDYLEGTPNPHK
jgi:hypothetical protein